MRFKVQHIVELMAMYSEPVRVLPIERLVFVAVSPPLVMFHVPEIQRALGGASRVRA